jgi:hypothetical protein
MQDIPMLQYGMRQPGGRVDERAPEIVHGPAWKAARFMWRTLRAAARRVRLVRRESHTMRVSKHIGRTGGH